MATPDTSTLTSSAQIFTSYTLPQIRAIHKQLHSEIDEKSARLRTQVGTSYRQLLGTADTIVQMRQDMLATQEVLGHMGGQCGRAIVDQKVTGLTRFRGSEDADKVLGRTARVKILRSCGLAVGRLLKTGAGRDAGGSRGDRLVLAAKVFVLSRLLVSSFGDLKSLDGETRSAVDAAKKSLDASRRKLVRAVEKVLQRTGERVSITDIMKALAAYSLASSSVTRDVLRRFLSIRAEAITYEFDYEEHGKDRGADHVLRGLELFTKTLVDVQALVPNRLPEALLELKRTPLLADESLRSLEGLRLDIYERWCGDEIRYFTPFIRHDDLDGKQVKEMLTGWARKGEETVLAGLGNTLEHITDFKAIVELRTSTLQQWIRDGGKVRGFDPSAMLDGLRETINNHLLRLVETKVAKLKLIGSEVAATLDAWKPGVTDRQHSLWGDEMLDMDLSVGAAQVTQVVLSRVYGRNDAVARAVTSFESWSHIIDNVGDLVEQLERQRWDNDVDDIEDEEVIEERQALLSKNDPQLLHSRLNETLIKAFTDLDQQLAEAWEGQKNGANSGPVAMYILRILRDIRSRLPKLDGVRSFGLKIVPSLQVKLAKHVGRTPCDEFAATGLTRRRVAGKALWEGEPALPTQPSSCTFKLLQDLAGSMGDAGVDLWTPAAVKTLKLTFSRQLADVWHKELATEDTDVEPMEPTTEPEGEEGANQPAEEEGNTEKESEKTSRRSEPNKDILIQWLFDINLLQCYFAAHDTEPGKDKPLTELESKVAERIDLDAEAKRRLVKASEEYWKRTSLLFGLLA
ncbi:hypothetical protein F5Y17DRAFT_40305 [Xylariaceae sp. FL0594]|nr:hypothetical protein F5Y17DRAFT_40305 [Xylariaceae sp. FL0594]